MKSDTSDNNLSSTASDAHALLVREREWLLREKYGGVKSKAFHADCARLATGEPLGYVIGHVPFLDCTIWLDSHPLIPRPETEYWVEKAIDEIKKIMPSDYKKNQPIPLVTKSLGREWRVAPAGFSELNHNPKEVLREKQVDATIMNLPQREFSEQGPDEELPDRPATITILDLCAGSGAIGVAVAKAIPEARVTFAEIDPAHLPTIEKNLQENCPTTATRVALQQIIESDLFTNIAPTQTFDFILTNPPYIDPKANTVEDSVVLHEPHLALFGGVGGMGVIARIIEAERAKLAPPTSHRPKGGQLWIEHEPFQSTTIITLARTHGLTCITHHDQYHTPRYSILTVA